jgi:peptide deformylase
MSLPELPPGWCAPTSKTLKQYADGVRSGLVPAGAAVLRQPAEEIAPQDANSREVVDILGRMYEVVKAMRGAGRALVGLAAPQIGEPAQIVLVPRPADSEEVGYGDLMPVINPRTESNSKGGLIVVGHGCFSSDQTCVRLAVPGLSTLSGLDHNGEEIIIRRNDWKSVVDFHEVLHLDGLRPPDIAVRESLPIDCLPPEMNLQYSAFLAVGDHTAIPRPEWGHNYPYEQWFAVKVGDFALSQYLEE